ncbi:hypothetical protein ACQEWB_23830 [Streptomyces sp. CA-249302]|uniref:hypothetical protein n=1 Tax=Streptomyces sp. CA-249302 TaxID=3240058 RepID=UPI003D8E3EC1
MLRGTPGTTWTHGRRGAAIGASAAVVCLGAALAACGGGAREGYVATGVVGGAPTASGAAPTGRVTLVPLDGADGSSNSPAGAGGSGSASGPAAGSPRTPGASATTGIPVKSGSTTVRSPSATPTPGGGTAPAGPAALSWSGPVRTATDQRWCEDVTLGFSNSGGTAVRSGTVTFGTHVIGALGLDWGTVESTVDLPVPIEGGAGKKKTWTVCVDAWRVPLGMHIETRDVAVRWK